MNYISEINRFYDWLETNPMSDSSIILWHALMHINNKTGWRHEFTVAVSTLEVKTALSKSSIIRARKLLQDTGRIKVKTRDGQQSAVYTLVAFLCEPQSDTQSGTQSVPQSAPQTVPQTVPINKLNYTKQEIQIQYVFPSDVFKCKYDEWVSARKEKKKALTEKMIQSQMKFLGKFPEDVAIEIIEKSIMNGWQGLFEPKDYKATPEVKTIRKSMFTEAENQY